MNVLVQAGWTTKSSEANSTHRSTGLVTTSGYLRERTLVELEERYGVTTPVEDRFQELMTRYYRGLEVL